jgi:hypothetical protein
MSGNDAGTPPRGEPPRFKPVNALSVGFKLYR